MEAETHECLLSRFVMGRMSRRNRPLEQRNPGRHQETAAEPTDRGRRRERCFPAAKSRPVGARGRTTPAWRVLAVCGFLLLAVALVFGQTVRHEFVNYDDDEYVYENPHVSWRLDRRRDRLGLHHHPCQQLASADLALAHAGLPALRTARRRTPPDQRPAARRHGDPAVSGPAADDGRSVAQRLGGGRVCRPSACGWNRWPGWRSGRTSSAGCSSC